MLIACFRRSFRVEWQRKGESAHEPVARIPRILPGTVSFPKTLAGGGSLPFPVGARGAGLPRPRHSPPTGGGGGLRGDSPGRGRAAARGAREAGHIEALCAP